MYDRIEFIRKILEESLDSTPNRVAVFFKRGVGEYAHHDQFMGIRVPTLRKIAKDFLSLTFDELWLLIRSPFNEERLLALIILTQKYKTSSYSSRQCIYEFYTNNLDYVNNWNLVDSSAHLILGAYLWDKDKKYLIELANNESIWKRRIAIISTWYFIKKRTFDWTFKIAILLQKDKHDLIHKAVGWMLREVGKKDSAQLTTFLEICAHQIPRTMLRYAIEKFPEEQRLMYLQKKSDKMYSINSQISKHR